MEQLTYPGYMSSEASEFFGDSLVKEKREGCATVGHFIKIQDGRTVMPSKGDIFVKDKDGRLKLV